MKLKVQQVMDAYMALASIAGRQAAMPQKGKYRVARLESKLRDEFRVASERRDDMIKAYDHKAKVQRGDQEVEDFTVPDDKLAEFHEKWKEIADQEIEVDVQPIPLGQLDLGNDHDGAVSVQELIALGPLVADDEEGK
jgi:hypothetical protein